MERASPGFAGALLVLVALLAGGGALWAVTVQDPDYETAASSADVDAVAEEAPKGEESGQAIADVLTSLAGEGIVPAELQDPAFDYYVDLVLVGTAWVELDAVLITDLSLQFMEGERVLLRSHRAIDSADLMQIAIRLATVKGDAESLARLEKAVERSDNKELATELAEAKKQIADAEGEESAWNVPVATTSAAEFARYKGVLQDIEAAIVVRDLETLETLKDELQQMMDLPAPHRQKLDRKIEQALTVFSKVDQRVSRAAKVLDKLAHSTRRSTPDTLPDGSGFLTPPNLGWRPTEYPEVPTECPQQLTRCPAPPTQCGAVSTTCPQGSVATQCPATLTQCPREATRCPEWQTRCPSGQCNQPTQFPSFPTQCQPITTHCPGGQCDRPTQYPGTPTQCQQQVTVCPMGQCQQPTQYPSMPTQCRPAVTYCPTTGCDRPTQSPKSPTQCQSTQTGKCGRPTLYPSVPTRCPALMTRCPQSITICPPICGQQQQQRQRPITPRKGKYYPGSGGYQQEWPGQMGAPSSPYRRRDYSGSGG
jgi:hypothetical protein